MKKIYIVIAFFCLIFDFNFISHVYVDFNCFCDIVILSILVSSLIALEYAQRRARNRLDKLIDTLPTAIVKDIQENADGEFIYKKQ